MRLGSRAVAERSFAGILGDFSANKAPFAEIRVCVDAANAQEQGYVCCNCCGGSTQTRTVVLGCGFVGDAKLVGGKQKWRLQKVDGCERKINFVCNCACFEK